MGKQWALQYLIKESDVWLAISLVQKWNTKQINRSWNAHYPSSSIRNID